MTVLCCSREPSIVILVHDLTSARAFAIIRRMHKLPVSLGTLSEVPPVYCEIA